MLVQIMQGFDLIFEARELGGAVGAQPSYFVPGLLKQNPLLLASAESETVAPVRCYFVFCNKDGGSPLGSDANLRKLPHGLFSRLLVKACRWSQFTSDVPPELASESAVLTFGVQTFVLSINLPERAILFTAKRCTHPLGVAMSLKGMLDEILYHAFPLLRCDVGIGMASGSGAVELVDLLRAQEAARLFTGSETSVTVDNIARPIGLLRPWLVLEDSLTPSSFDVFLCFRGLDASFAGKLEDCIARQTLSAGRGRVRVFPSFVTGQHDRIQGLARSRIFVPVISSACLEQWHHEQPPVTALQIAILAGTLGSIAHMVIDMTFTQHLASSLGAASWQVVVMVISLTVPLAAQAAKVSGVIKKELCDGRDFAMWHTRHSGAFPLFLMLGTVRPDMMVALMRCRAPPAPGVPLEAPSRHGPPPDSAASKL